MKDETELRQDEQDLQDGLPTLLVRLARVFSSVRSEISQETPCATCCLPTSSNPIAAAFFFKIDNIRSWCRFW